MVDVVAATTPRAVAEALALRQAVLGVGSSDDYDRDPTTLHCVVTDPNGVCVGAGRLTAPVDVVDRGELVEGNPVVGPIVVAPTARRGGVARAILAHLEAEALALYGRNGSVTVEAWVPEAARRTVAPLGYSVVADGVDDRREGALRAANELAAS